MSETKPKTKPAAEPEPTQPAPAAPHTPTAPDEHHGKGGHYEIRNGQRTLVQRTTQAKE